MKKFVGKRELKKYVQIEKHLLSYVSTLRLSFKLGGPDYTAASTRIVDAMGELVSTSKSGYKYFGAAKNLPGVRELFEKDVGPGAERRTRAQIYRTITPDYYGWRDEVKAAAWFSHVTRCAEYEKRKLYWRVYHVMCRMIRNFWH